LAPFQEAPMTTFRNTTHAALIAVLSSQRKGLKLTVRSVAARMPKHLGWDHTTLVKIEKGRRNISFVETRELAPILELNIATIDLSMEALENANFTPAPEPRPPRKKK
jgi:transcriptional regulator with XRE-family HTH domain